MATIKARFELFSRLQQLGLLRKSDVKPGENLDSVYNRGFAVCD